MPRPIFSKDATVPDCRAGFVDAGINGIWLIPTVSTQSISVLSATLVYGFPGHRPLILFFSLSMFLIGCMLYVIIITLIFYRMMFFQLAPEDRSRPYWINTGAVAIIALAGAMLVQDSPWSTFLERLFPFIIGFTLFFWSIATWRVPLLLLLDAWRYIVRRETFSMIHRTGEWYFPSVCMPSAPFSYPISPAWNFCSLFHASSSMPC